RADGVEAIRGLRVAVRALAQRRGDHQAVERVHARECAHVLGLADLERAHVVWEEHVARERQDRPALLGGIALGDGHGQALSAPERVAAERKELPRSSDSEPKTRRRGGRRGGTRREEELVL